MISLILIWLCIGLISTIASIFIFRQNGTDRMQELILAAFAPFFGPVVLVILVIDFYRLQKERYG